MNNLENNIKEFVSNLVEKKNNKNIKDVLIQYKEFLFNTRMIKANDEITIWLNKVIENAEIIQLLRDKNGHINLELFLQSVNIICSDNTKIDKKHYGHYGHDEDYGHSRRITYVNSCGSVSTTVDSC